MTVIQKDSGTKHTIKITNPSQKFTATIKLPLISPQKGTQNPPHYHIKLPALKG
jgi:hypothetical protein